MKKIRSLNQLLYEVSVYSFKKNVEVDCNKFKLQDLSDLADHQNVKTAYCNEYGLVALYDEGKNLNMIIQVWSKDGESPKNAAINWLNYLNIVSQSGDADAKAEENKKQTDTKINESNPTGWSIDKCKQLVQRMYDNLSEWAKGLLPEEDLPVVWGEKLPTDRYIVSDAQALIRDKNGKELEGKPKIPQGTEVKIVPNVTTTDGAYIQVEVVGSNPKQLHYTAASNLTKIYTENFTCYAVKTDVPIYEIPFANSSKSNKFVVGKEYKFNYYCADYALLEGTKSQEKFSGVWVKYDDENIKRVYDLSKNPETKVIGNNALTKDDFVSSPYSTNKYSWGSSFNQDKFRAEKEIKVIASCGDYYLLEGTKGNQDFSGAWIKKDKLGCDIEEQKRLIHNALEEVIAAMGIKQQSCNLCTRKALYYLTGDPVLFPEKSEMKGLISGDGRASNIIADLESNSLSEYFDEIKKSDNETYDQYWKRLQDLADGGSVIVGTYKNNHVFLIVPGGLYDVVDNENHMDKNGYILEEYKDDPDISAGDRYGHSFAKSGRNHKRVNRILECGTNVKSDDAPVYAGMDWKGYKGSRFYKYKKPLRPIR